MKRFKLILSAFCVIITLVVVLQRPGFRVTRYTVRDTDLPRGFENFKILQISDLHDNFYDSGNESVLNAVKSEKPDIIVITGDYVDKSSDDISELIRFSEKLSKIAECYYTTGNHEVLYCKEHSYKEYIAALESSGMTVLDDRFVTLKRNGSAINIAGLKDPLFRETEDKKFSKTSEVYEESYRSLGLKGYTVLLAHRPYDFETFVQLKVNLVISGHEHGGQIRLPFAGGLFAPGEGFFPEYDRGLYQKENTQMVVSVGLGNGEAPIRIGNQPEIVVIELKGSGTVD